MDEGQCNESYVRKIRDRVNLLGYEALVRTGLIIEFGTPGALRPYTFRNFAHDKRATALSPSKLAMAVVLCPLSRISRLERCFFCYKRIRPISPSLTNQVWAKLITYVT